MTDAPERIWAFLYTGSRVKGEFQTTSISWGTEYVRADIAASQLAEARASAERQWAGWVKEEALRKSAEAERDRLAADLEYWQTVKHSSHWKAQVEAMAPALRQCQKILAVLSRPEGQADISILWAQCVEAEAKARAALIAGKE